MQVHVKLCQIAKKRTENPKAIESLADRVEDFAYDLLDQVKQIEEEKLHDEAADRYSSSKAISKGRKKVHYNFYLIPNFSLLGSFIILNLTIILQFVSHPFIFKRVEKRWKLGLSEDIQSRLPHRFLLLLIMMLDAILTPVMLPLNAYVAYKNQQGTKLTNIQGILNKFHFQSSMT